MIAYLFSWRGRDGIGRHIAFKMRGPLCRAGSNPAARTKLQVSDLFKQCNKCSEWKSFEEFYDRKISKDGKHNTCKICINNYQRNRYKNDEVRNNHLNRCKNLTKQQKIEAKERSDKFYKSVRGRARSLLHNARKSSKSKNMECSLTLEHIIQGIESERCPVTGVRFDLGNSYQIVSGTKKNPFAPSLDRIDPKLGYTNQNVRIVIWQYNLMKGELSDSQVLYLCGKIMEMSK